MQGGLQRGLLGDRGVRVELEAPCASRPGRAGAWPWEFVENALRKKWPIIKTSSVLFCTCVPYVFTAVQSGNRLASELPCK